MDFKIKQKWAVLFLVFVSMVYLLIYFWDSAYSKSKVVEIFYADRITAAHRILINEYNRINEGKIKVIPIDFPNFDFSTNERKEVLARSLRGGGDGIDLFAVDLIWVQRFAKWCEPLGKYFTDTEKNRILECALESCYYDGDLVAVPFDFVQGIMYYREDLIKQNKNAGEILKKINSNITWSDFIKLKNEIGSRNPFYIYPAADFEGLICSFMEMVLSLRPKYFEEVGFNFNTPEAERSLQMLVDLVNKYGLTPPEVTNLADIPSYEYFINNDALFVRGWPSYDKDFKETPINAEKESRLKKTAIPHFADGKQSTVFGGWNLMILKFSNIKEQVIDFIKFLLREESQEIIYRESGHYPVVKSFYNDPEYLKKYPEISQLKEMQKYGVHRPANVDYTKYSKMMSYYFEKAIQNKISVKQALEECTNAIQMDKVMIKEF
ncbi:MAG: extracellular solute-binding protein [bacterium]